MLRRWRRKSPPKRRRRLSAMAEVRDFGENFPSAIKVHLDPTTSEAALSRKITRSNCTRLVVILYLNVSRLDLRYISGSTDSPQPNTQYALLLSVKRRNKIRKVNDINKKTTTLSFSPIRWVLIDWYSNVQTPAWRIGGESIKASRTNNSLCFVLYSPKLGLVLENFCRGVK